MLKCFDSLFSIESKEEAERGSFVDIRATWVEREGQRAPEARVQNLGQEEAKEIMMMIDDKI